MKRKRILIVDDEKDLCQIIEYNLISNGYDADSVNSAEEAIQLDLNKYDLAILDVMMGRMSGFQLAESIKSNKSTSSLPIIFLTAKDSEEDTLLGFELGADDYITKPFGIRELLARVKAVLHRSEKVETMADAVLIYKGLSIDVESKTVTIDGKIANLTKKEYELLRILLSNKDHVLSRQQLVSMVWTGDSQVSDRTVDVNITRMRKKIGAYSSCIVTRQGFGYCFSVCEK
ncbi:MAG: response regulator transcription factor [Prevotella sp.]|nr:response regulator transcription factor [Prevotella sp.]MBQ9651432.1 response regulator transcription factor [Prevotella sp.]